MRIDEIRTILEYAADIPKKFQEIANQKAEIESELSCLRGVEYNGMPRGGEHSDPTADIAEWAIEKGYMDKLRELEEEERTLREDFGMVWTKIQEMNTAYAVIISENCLCGHSIACVARKIGYSVPHTKRMKAHALARLAEAMGQEEGLCALYARAYNARK